MQHHLCFCVYIAKTRAKRIRDTVYFTHHQYITNPTVSPESHVVAAAQQLATALQGNIPAGNEPAEALKKVSDLFTKIAAAKSEVAKVKAQCNRVRASPTAHQTTHLPRVEAPLPRVADPSEADCRVFPRATNGPQEDCRVVEDVPSPSTSLPVVQAPFHEWWVNHKKRPPIPDGHVIPILSALQGHPKSPRLREKHADAILREIGLTPTVHEPCLYSGIINDNRVLLKCQVDDFAIAASDTKTADIILDLIDDKLKIPVKRQGYLDMYNGIDVHQTCHYIKISVTSFIDKVFINHLETWMKSAYPSPTLSTPFPSDATWQKNFNAATGNPDRKHQSKLAKDMQIGYRSSVNELIWAMTTCRPDLAFSSVKL